MQLKETLEDPKNRRQFVMCIVLAVLILMLSTWLAVKLVKANAYVNGKTESESAGVMFEIDDTSDDDTSSSATGETQDGESATEAPTFTPLPTVDVSRSGNDKGE